MDGEADQELVMEMEEISKEVEDDMDAAVSATLEEANVEFTGEIHMIEESNEVSVKKTKPQRVKAAAPARKPPGDQSGGQAGPAIKKSQEKREVPIALQKPRKPKADPKKQAAQQSKESGFKVEEDSAESRLRAE